MRAERCARPSVRSNIGFRRLAVGFDLTKRSPRDPFLPSNPQSSSQSVSRSSADLATTDAILDPEAFSCGTGACLALLSSIVLPVRNCPTKSARCVASCVSESLAAVDSSTMAALCWVLKQSRTRSRPVPRLAAFGRQSVRGRHLARRQRMTQRGRSRAPAASQKRDRTLGCELGHRSRRDWE